MTLGDLLAAARRPGVLARWLAAADPALADAVGRAAEAEGQTLEAWARTAVADFAEQAGPEDWAALTQSLRTAADPALATLATMTRRRLAAAPRSPEPEPWPRSPPPA